MIELINGNLAKNEIEAFNSQYLIMMQNLSNLGKQKKQLESEEKKIKNVLKKCFDEYGIKSIDNEFIKITRVKGSEDSKTIDLKEFEKSEPETYADILEDYPKLVKGKSSTIRFDVK